MAKYFTRQQPPARASQDWWEPLSPLPHPSVYPSEPVKTGLLDASGADIYRGPDPIGYLNLGGGS